MRYFKRGRLSIACVCMVLGFMLAVQFRSTQDIKASVPYQRVEELTARLQQTEKDMKRAAKSLEFEEAAMWRDQLAKLRQMWTDRYGSRADAALKRVSAGKKRINRPMKKRI